MCLKNTCDGCGRQRFTRKILRRVWVEETFDEERGGYTETAKKVIDEQVFYPCACGYDRDNIPVEVNDSF